MTMVDPVSSATAPRRAAYLRHAWPVRLLHWINVISLTVLFMSGLQIFNAHPALYWGRSSYGGEPVLLEIRSRDGPDGAPRGYVRVLGHEFDTTGVLGVFRDGDGDLAEHAFPSWITLPGPYWLSMARAWHFLFAWVLLLNGLAYVLYGAASRHLQRDLLPTAPELAGIGGSIRDHLRFRHPTGEAARRYNVLQKLAYLVVIFVLLPLVILMGCAMSPMLDTVIPGWVDWFGGRQAARSLHFIVAWLLVAFVAIHVFQVVVGGFWNHLRSMITGRYVVTEDDHHA